MKARLIALLVSMLCMLSIATRAGQGIENLGASRGPTPFISFVHLRLSDPTRFEFAQFMIWPKTQSATRPVNVRYSRSYLEARGYLDLKHSAITVPIFGLYAGRLNSVVIDLNYGGRFNHKETFGIKITTPAYD